MVRGNNFDTDIEYGIYQMLRWNSIGVSHEQIETFPPSCKDRVLFILLILWQLPICDYMLWTIMCMLKVRDFVEDGDAWDRSTWT